MWLYERCDNPNHGIAKNQNVKKLRKLNGILWYIFHVGIWIGLFIYVKKEKNNDWQCKNGCIFSLKHTFCFNYILSIEIDWICKLIINIIKINKNIIS